MRVPKISGKGGTFRATKSGPRIVKKKKRGVFDFSPGDFFKKGVVFLSLSLWTPEKFKKGVINKNIGGTLSSVLDLGGSPRQEKPAKGGFRNVVSPEIGGAFKGRERAYAYPK